MRERLIIGVAMAAVLAGVAVFIGTLSRAVIANPEPEGPPPAAAAASYGLQHVTPPIRLSIPTIGVDAAVQSVGITKKGSMSSPNNFTDVGWYRYGTVPGERGSAVLAGHLDNGLALAGVLKRLQEVHVGDDVGVTTKDGTKLVFRVAEINTYPFRDAPVDLIFNRDDAARLNIITCAGDWIPSEKTYSKRLVVSAVLESSQ